MSQTERQLHMSSNIVGSGRHEMAWRVQDDPFAFLNIEHFHAIARAGERATLDALFLADLTVLGDDASSRPWHALEPTVLLAAMAAVTERVGLIATAHTTFNEPYNIARRIAALDHISGGRAAWNIVTGINPKAGGNFGLTQMPEQEERYGRATEFVEIVVKLWESWDYDALVGDVDTGVFAAIDKVHALDHEGRYYSVRGPLDVPRTPQGRPVIVQSGASDHSRDLGARFGDMLFTVQSTMEEAQAFYSDIKSRAAAYGRDPDDVLVVSGVQLVIGGTEEEAWARKAELDALLDLEKEHAALSERLGIRQSRLPLDRELPDEIVARQDGAMRWGGFTETQVRQAAREHLTVRDILTRNLSGGHRVLVGAPEQIADNFEHWFHNRAVDGFNINSDMFPSGLDALADHVVPELRRRGIYRHEYTGSTLRSHLGLPGRPGVATARI